MKFKSTPGRCGRLLFALTVVYHFFCAQSYAQKCGTDSIIEQMKVLDPQYDQKTSQQQISINNWINNNQALLQSSNHVTIPVVVHVIHPYTDATPGTGTNISYAQIQSQINALNAAFAKNYPAYNGQSHGSYAVNTDIQFCLATIPMGPSGWTSSTEPGVMRYSINPSTYPAGAIYDNASTVAGGNQLLNCTHPNSTYFPFEKYLNIWVVRSINTITPSVIGYANVPIAAPFPIDGVVIRSDCFGDNSVSTNNFNLLPQLTFITRSTGCPAQG